MSNAAGSNSGAEEAERLARLDKQIAEFTMDNSHLIESSYLDPERRARYEARYQELRGIREEEYARRLAALSDEAFWAHRPETHCSPAYDAEWEKRSAKKAQAEAQHILDERVLSAAEKKTCAELGVEIELLPLRTAEREEIYAALAAPPAADAPAWVRTLGVNPKHLKYLNRQTRRAALRRLVNKAEFMLAIELQERRADEHQEDYTLFWDPVDEVAHALEMARSALSAFSKELTGLTVAQLADRQRGKAVKQKFKAALRAFVREVANLTPRPPLLGGEGETEGAERRARLSVEEAWHKLNAARKKGRTYSLSSQAAAMGFSSYARFSRACLALHGKTPGEIEYDVLSECVEEYYREAQGEGSGDRGEGSGTERAQRTEGAAGTEEAEPTLAELRLEFARRWPPVEWRRAEAVRSAG